ncbi:MAG TPA: zinc ribbon domain-containing protein [Thermoanaerobaculia bacterium]
MTADSPKLSADRIACASCRHDIDAAARLCPYCGADPRTGTKPVDTRAMLNEMFHPRPQASASATVVEFARQRQGVVITLAVLLVMLLLAGLHEYVTRRNARDVSAAAAIPLTDVTDLSNQQDENRPLPLPKIEYQFDGHPQTMRRFVVEPGAVTPPEVVAAQQTATVPKAH